MLRCVVLLVAFAATVPLSAVAYAQRPKIDIMSKGIKLGEKFEGEFGEQQKLGGTWRSKGERFGNKLDPNLYQGAIPVTLKAGHGITITATVTGQDRFVGIRVLDPTGKRIKEEKERLELLGGEVPEPGGITLVSPKTAELTIKEVSANGKYTIIVVSNRVGAFTVQATSGSGEDDRESLEKELKDLRRRVAEIEAKLKALDEKGKK